jgi:hypothetical protein
LPAPVVNRLKLKWQAEHRAWCERRLDADHWVYLWVDGIYSQTRLALVYYFIRRNNLDLRSADIPPERTQLYLQNYEEITAAGEQLRGQLLSLDFGYHIGINRFRGFLVSPRPLKLKA